MSTFSYVPDRALERDRDDLVGRLEQVHAGVVVIDDLARLLDDRPADRLDAFWRLIRADAAWSTLSWAARCSVRANRSALSIAIAAWVATATANSTSAVDHVRGACEKAASAPITRSSSRSGTTSEDWMSRIPA